MSNTVLTGENVSVQLRLQPINRATPLDLIVGGPAAAPPLTPATLQGNLFIDPQNSTGNAGTGPGFGTSATKPITSFAALAQAWGTTSPYITTPTVVQQLSPHTDGTDPVILSPIIASGASIVYETTPTVVTAGVVLSGVVPKNRAAGANSLLEANLGGTAAVGMMVENTTAGKSSRCWVYASLGGGLFSLTQPVAKLTVPGAVSTTEVDTWANGDTVNLLQPLNVNVASFTPSYTDDTGFSNNAAYLYSLTIFAPTANDYVTLGGCRVSECSSNRQANFVGTRGTGGFQGNNFLMSAGLTITGANAAVYGGAVKTGQTAAYNANLTFDVDFVLAGSLIQLNATTLNTGNVYIDSNVILAAGSALKTARAAGGSIIYGNATATINLVDTSHADAGSAGTFAARWTLASLVSPGILLNGASTGSTHTNASPDVLTSNVATTVANADAATNGTIFNLGGASIRQHQ